jgi:phospholipid/cholesterol/gamma-HCH transport system substrate-binding protein
MARHNPAELGVGAVVLAVAGAFLVFAIANTGQGFGTGGYTLHAVFDHVDGLAPGADVRIAGVKIGSITGIKLDPKTYLADVHFTVQNGIKLSDDSSATVSTDGLLGGKYLALATGGDDTDLKPGGAITITQGSLNIESLIGKYLFPSPSGGKGGSGAAAGGAKQSASSSAGSGPSAGDGIAPLK